MRALKTALATVAAAGTIAVSMTAPATAQAVPPPGSVAIVNGSTLMYIARANEVNKVTITLGDSNFYTVEDVVPLTPGAGCTRIDPTRVRCTAANINAVDVRVGDRDDYVRASITVRAIVTGGQGDDELRGGSGFDNLYGRAGNDRLYGNTGNDKLYGEQGNDRVYGDAGQDSLWGGDGADSLHGGTERDVIRGDAGNDTLKGGDGNDRLLGGTGNDTIFGDAGRDRLHGEAGIHDRGFGGSGFDICTSFMVAISCP
ncbi:calcium-binding protein [Nonomuraea sp. LPB2021202275-12-8]|uniref:calcium-binding protein n=1 Tax=Nonomuraea sp. LPB2021202275-12-8 TaxID=3120159 RepID=UPI00300CB01E